MLLCLFDGAKVRRFLYIHNPDFVAFHLPHIWYVSHFAHKKAMRHALKLNRQMLQTDAS